jgi:hypothetical protein
VLLSSLNHLLSTGARGADKHVGCARSALCSHFLLLNPVVKGLGCFQSGSAIPGVCSFDKSLVPRYMLSNSRFLGSVPTKAARLLQSNRARLSSITRLQNSGNPAQNWLWHLLAREDHTWTRIPRAIRHMIAANRHHVGICHCRKLEVWILQPPSSLSADLMEVRSSSLEHLENL